jgi:GT2 family glycosyltransferase
MRTGLDQDRRPSVSVVIPTIHGGADLESCLVSLAAEDYGELDVIVVDNASSGDAVRRLPERYARLRVVRNEVNRGFAGASNQGIAQATGELVLLLNDDTVVEPGALRRLVTAMVDHPTWGACQAKLLLMDDPERLDTAGSFLTATGFLVHRGAHEPEAHYAETDEIFAAKGAALLIRRRAIDDVGVFDPDFFAYFEESDLCWRLWIAGWRVGFVADARVLHRLGATASTLPTPFVQFHSFKNRICTLLKNLGATRLAWMVPYHLTLCLALAAWYALRGRFALAAAIVRAVGWNLTHLPQTLRKRRAVQAQRRVSDRELMRSITTPTQLRTLATYARRTG